MLRRMIRLTRPSLGDEEARAVAEVLRTGMLAQGERVARFEALVAARCGRKHAVAVTNGTAALELALTVLGVGPGDEVLVPDLTWPSPAHAVVRRGARPVLVDVDRAEWNATAESLRAARTERTRAAIAVDQFGFPARHVEIADALAGLPVVEDAACAIGSTLDDAPCGSMGAVACLSFHPRKVITTGEGGMCLTDDDALAVRLRILRNHGQAEPGRFAEVAGNHRMTEVAAAIGIVQMTRLDGILEARRTLARRYLEALPELDWQQPAPGAEPSYQTMGLVLPDGIDRDGAIARCRAEGIEAGILSYALHRLPTLGIADTASFPNAEAIAERGMAVPLYEGLAPADQDRVISALRAILRDRR